MNYCKRCEVKCFDEEFCEECKEHIAVCGVCGVSFDKSNLADVFNHEHKDIRITNTNGIVSKRIG